MLVHEDREPDAEVVPAEETVAEEPEPVVGEPAKSSRPKAVIADKSKEAPHFTHIVKGDGSTKKGLELRAEGPAGSLILKLSVDREGYDCYRVEIGPGREGGPQFRPLVGGRFKDA